MTNISLHSAAASTASALGSIWFVAASCILSAQPLGLRAMALMLAVSSVCTRTALQLSLPPALHEHSDTVNDVGEPPPSVGR